MRRTSRLPLIIGIVALCQALPAAPPKAIQPHESIQYYRILVPADNRKQLAQPGYFPIARKQFDEYVKRLKSNRSGRTDQVKIAATRYTARFNNGNLSGTVSASVKKIKREGLAVFELGATNHTVRQPVWSDVQQPAEIGLANTGRQVLLVPRSGNLEFSFAQRPKRLANGSLQFDMRLLSAPVCRFVFSAPEPYSVTASAGILRNQGTESLDGQTFRKWSVELGGTNQFSLTLQGKDRANVKPKVRFRQSSTYRFQLPGLTLQSDIQLSVQERSIRQLVLHSERPLRIVDVRLGGESLPFSTQRRQQVDEVTVNFPQPLLGTDRVIRVTAMTPIVIARSWTLPTITIPAFDWKHGTAELVLPSNLDMTGLTIKGGRHWRSIQQIDGGEIRTLQLYEPTSSVSLSLARRQARLIAKSGTTISIQRRSMRAEFVSDIKSNGPNVFQASFVFPSAWEIDQVSTDPPEALEQTERQRVGRANFSRLAVKLKKPIAAAESVRIRIAAHHRFPPSSGVTLTSRHLRVFHVSRATENTHIACVNVAIPSQLKLLDDVVVKRVSAKSLQADDRERLTTTATSKLFVLSPKTDFTRFRWQRGQQRFAAQVKMSVLRTETELQEVYRIHCRPSSLEVNNVRIHLSQPRNSPIEWSLADAPTKTLPAKKSQLAGAERLGEDWTIQLQPPRANPFVIVGRRSTPANAVMTVSTASLPEASPQEGYVEVYGSAPLAWRVQTGMKASPGPTNPDGFRHLLSSYQYDPAQNQPLIIAPAPADSRHALWIWDYHLESRVTQSGRIQHRLRMRCQNHGQTKLNVAIPKSLELDQLWVDGRERAIEGFIQSRQDGTVASIPISAMERFPVVELGYHERDAEVNHMVSRLTIQFPKPNVPVLHRRWEVGLPPGLSLLNREEKTGWMQRLGHRFFGDLLQVRNNFQPKSSHEELARQAVTVAQQLGTKLNTTNLTWGAWLSAFQEQSERSNDVPSLLIDTHLLDDIGIRPVTKLVVANPNADPQSRTLAVLRKANAILICSPDIGTVLTSRRFLTHLSPDCRSRFKLRNGSSNVVYIAEDLSSHESLMIRRRFDVINAWNLQPGRFRVAWSERQSAPFRRFADEGWSYCEVTLPDAITSEKLVPVAALTVVDDHTMRGFALAVFLAAAAVGWSLANRSLRFWFAFTVLLGVANCLLPIPMITLVTVAFWGCFSGVGLSALKPVRSSLSRQDDDFAERSTVTLAITSSSVGIGLIALAVVGSSISTRVVGAAGPPEANEKEESKAKPKTKSKRRLFAVLDPVDKNRKPVGKYLRIPRPFFDELVRRSENAKRSSLDWIITTANYQLVLNPSQQNTVTANFQLQVLRTGATVAIPFGKGVLPLIQSATMDGKSVGVRWQPNSSNLLIDSSSEGSYGLSVTFALPRARAIANRITIPIPMISQSSLQVTSPNVRDVQVEANGPLVRDEEGKSIAADLGPIDRVAILWNRSRSPASLDQLLWMNIKPQSVVLRAKLKLKSIQPDQQSVQLDFDGNLRVISKSWPGELVVNRSANQRQTTRVTLTQQQRQAKSATIEVEFLVTDAMGVGIIDVPIVRVADCTTMSRWVGVTVDPQLQLTQQERPPTVPLVQFLKAWGTTNETLQSAHDCQTVLPRFRTRYRQSVSKASQKLVVVYHRSWSTLDFTAEVETTLGGRFQHRFSVPPRFRVERVRVMKDEEEIPVSRVRNVGGFVTVFLGRELRGNYRLQLFGRLSHIRNESTVMPRVTLEETSLLSDDIHLCRYAHSRLTIADRGMRGYAKFNDPEFTAAPHTRLVMSLRRSISQETRTFSAPRIAVRPNRCQATSVSVMRVKRDADNWSAMIDHRVRVAQGLLDAVRLEVPNSWSGPFVISPDTPYEVEDLPDVERKVLILKLPAPVQSGLTYRVRISGPINVPGTAPSVIPLDVRTSKSYVLLPKEGQAQKFNWAGFGLRRAIWQNGSWTKAARNLAGDPNLYEAYQVVGSSFEAKIKQVQLQASNAMVRLVDHHAHITNDGKFYGISTFDIQPAGQIGAGLTLPPQASLLYIKVAGLPAQIRQDKTQKIQVQFGSAQLPQRMEVCYQGKLRIRPRPNREFDFAVPQIANVDVERSIWTMHGPSWSRHIRCAEKTASQVRQDQIRLAAFSSILELPSDVVAADQLRPWARRWFERFAVARRSLQLQILSSAQSPQDLDEARILDLDAQQATHAKRLGVEDQHTEVTKQLTVSETAQQRWQQIYMPSQSATLRLVSPGNRSSIKVTLDDDTARRWWQPLTNLAIYFLVVLGGCVLFSIARRLINDGFPAQLLGALGGMVLICLVTPQIIGVSITTICVSSILIGWMRR